MSTDQIVLIFLAVVGTTAAVISAYCDLKNLGGGGTVESPSSSPAYSPRRHYIVMGIFLLLTWGAVVFNYYSFGTAPLDLMHPWENETLKQISNRTFQGQTVVLDGYEYINCTFDDVTFVYNGTAPTRMTQSQIIHQVQGIFAALNIAQGVPPEYLEQYDVPVE